ncbi:MAG: hypothetical protein ABIT70_08360, partial [Sulfuriferula sp.]
MTKANRIIAEADSVNSTREKKCSKCGEVKLETEFHKNKTKKDGLASNCKVCTAAVGSRYRAENRDRRRAFHARYRAENRDRILASRARYRADNRDRILAFHARYRAENRDRIRASRARYIADNRDRIHASRARDISKLSDTYIKGMIRGKSDTLKH